MGSRGPKNCTVPQIILGMVQGVGKNRIERDKRGVKFRLIMRSGTETHIFMVSWDALSQHSRPELHESV